jgi:hypothetical protein
MPATVHRIDPDTDQPIPPFLPRAVGPEDTKRVKARAPEGNTPSFFLIQGAALLSDLIPYEAEVALAHWQDSAPGCVRISITQAITLWRFSPSLGDSPYWTQLKQAEALRAEAAKLRAVIAKKDERILDLKKTLTRLQLQEEVPGSRYTIHDVGAGDLVDQIEDALETVARDTHSRPQIGEPRKITVNIKAEMSEGGAAIKWAFATAVSLAKSEGGGVAFIDKDGRLMPPGAVQAEQLMLTGVQVIPGEGKKDTKAA